MTTPDPTTLPLRDIHLPPEIGWWPLASGWWLAITALAVLTAIVVLRRWYRARTRVQNAALKELAAIEQTFAESGDRHAFAQGLSAISRRVAVVCDGRLAACTGAEWLSELRRIGGPEIPPELAPVLIQAPYSQRAANRLDASHYARTVELLRAWLRKLNQRKRQVQGV